MQPADIVLGRTTETEVADLQRNKFERDKSPSRGQIGEIHQHQIIAKVLVTCDSLIVIEEITTAIENEPVTINLDRLLGRCRARS